MDATAPSPPRRWRRILRLGIWAYLITLLGLEAERRFSEDSVVDGGVTASLELLFVIPDPQYIGQLPLYVEFHKILASDREMTEREEERLINLFHQKQPHIDTATSELITDMYGSLIHRQNLSGTRYRIERDGDVEKAKRLALPATDWGYEPKNDEKARLDALKTLVINNERMSDRKVAEVIEIVKRDESHRVWRHGNDLLKTWQTKGHFEDTLDYRDSKWASERRALGPFLSLIKEPPFNYNPEEEDDIKRLLAVKNFIAYFHRNVNENPGEAMPWEALSDLMVIHQWEQNFDISKAAWVQIRHGSVIQGLYLTWNEDMHWDKDSLQPPFPWNQLPTP